MKVKLMICRIDQAVGRHCLQPLPQGRQHFSGAGDPGSQRPIPQRNHHAKRGDLPRHPGDPLEIKAVRPGEGRGDAARPPPALRVLALREQLIDYS